MKMIKRILKERWFIFAVIFMVYVFINIPLADKADDLIFKEINDAVGGVWNWLRLYVTTWSGRVIPHGILVLLLQMPGIVFKLINASMLTLLVCLGHKYCAMGLKIPPKQEKIFIGALAIAGICFIPVSILSGSVFWKAATVLYLWGLVAALLACLPFVTAYFHPGEPIRLHTKILALAGAVYAGNFEQTGPIVLAMGIILCLLAYIQQKRILPFQYVILAVSGISFGLSLASPGNSVRYQAEIIAQFSSYGTFSILDKVFIGSSLVLDFFKEHYSILLLLISWLAVILINKRKKGREGMLFALIPAAYYSFMILVNFLSRLYETDGLNFERMLYTYLDFDSGQIDFSRYSWLSTFAGIVAFVFLVLTVWILVSDQKEWVFASLLAASFLDVVIMGFSPSVYVSGSRVGYISGMLLIFVMFRLVYLIYSKTAKLKVHEVNNWQEESSPAEASLL